MTKINDMQHKSDTLKALSKEIFKIGKALNNYDIISTAAYHRLQSFCSNKYKTDTYKKYKLSFKIVNSDIDWAKKDLVNFSKI